MPKIRSRSKSKVPANPVKPDAISSKNDGVFGSRFILPELEERHRQADLLLKNIKDQLPRLEELLAKAEDHWVAEDGVYRFYHQSFKVYGRLQPIILEIVTALQSLLPGRELNTWFTEIVAAGTGESFSPDHNRKWTLHTRPIVEAFFHAHFMLKMVCKYGRVLSEAPQMLPSGWAAVLYLYNLR